MVATGMPALTSSTLAADDGFDETDVVLRMGIVSDLHVGRGTADARKNYVQKYADSILALDEFANNHLDALLLCGDYTEDGTNSEATTFASASKAILDVINKDKDDSAKTKFVMTYGNHDTERNGAMDYTAWESLLETYELLGGVTKGPEGSGSYKATIEKNGKTYTIFSVETDKYNDPGSNMFRRDVLEWLDEGLQAVTTSNPDSYVYVISHAPIQGTGVYGSDMDFYGNANWATAKPDKEQGELSSKIDEVLKDYPQVMYFSGHTHLTNSLESTIMSKDYTAVNVANLLVSDLIYKADYPCDNIDNATKDGFALYLEVDADGNQRIQRIVKPYDSAECTISYSETVTDPTKDVVVNSIAKGTVTTPNAYGNAWTMNAPDTSKSHLKKYTADRKATPTFAEGASVTTSEAYVQDGKLMLDVEFDKATCTNTIIRYEISLISPNGTVCSTKWVLGNWTDCQSGVPEGTTRENTTKFKYFVTNLEEAGDAIGYRIGVTAVDEFGGRSQTITSDPISDVQQYLTEQSDRFVKDELFNTETVQMHASYPGSEGAKITTTGTGEAFTTELDNIKGNEKGPSTDCISFFTAESKYAGASMETPDKNLGKFSDLNPEDTFVYEASFTLETKDADTTPSIAFLFRLPQVQTIVENQTESWRSERSGLLIDDKGVSLMMYDRSVSLTSDIKLQKGTDPNSHSVKIISSNKLVSIYIDGTMICENRLYTGEKFSLPEVSTDMYPVTAVRCWKDTKVTLTNQSLYYYYPEDEAKLHHGVDEIPGENEFNVTSDRVKTSWPSASKNLVDTEGSGADLKMTLTAAEAEVVKFFNSTEKYSNDDKFIKDVSDALGDYTDFDVNDTFVWETKFSFDNSSADGLSMFFNFRLPDAKYGNGVDKWRSETNGVWINGSNICLSVCNTDNKKIIATNFDTTIDKDHTIKIISSPTMVTVYLDGVLLCKDEPYNASISKWDDTKLNSKDMYPTLAFATRKPGTYKLWDQKVYKLHKEEITTYDKQENLVYSEIADLRCNVPGEGVAAIIGNSFYADMLATNTAVDTKYEGWDNTLTLLKSGCQLDASRSYVLSALGTVVEGSSNRLWFNLGKYDEEDVKGFISGTTLSVFTEDGDQYSVYTLPEYSAGDTFRLTALLTPFGFNLYFNGKLGYTHTFEDSSLVSYAPKFGIGTNVKGAWRDIVLYENVDNGQQYKEALSAEAEKLKNTLGVYLSEEDKTNISNAQKACDNLTGTNNETLVQYVGTLKYTKVYNNMVLEGLTSAKETEQRELAPVAYTQQHIPLFDDSHTCPITISDTWSVDFDLVVDSKNNKQYRIGLLIKGTSLENKTEDGSKGMMMLDNTVQAIWDKDKTDGNGFTQLGTTSMNPFNSLGQSYHFKFTIAPSTDGLVTITMTVKDESGKSEIFKGTFDAVTKITKPEIGIVNIGATISNLCVSYDLTEDINALETAKLSNSSRPTDGKALRSVALYQDACQVAEDLIVTKNKVNDFYTREEIRKATSDLSAKLLMYGDITQDDVRDARDIVRLKKQVANEDVEMDILVSDVNNSGEDKPDDKDVSALREALLK